VAQRTIVRDGEGVLALPHLPRLDPDGKLSDGGLSAINAAIRALYEKLDGGISFGSGEASSQAGNLDAQVIQLNVITGTNEIEVGHGLNRVPWGFHVVYRDGPVDVYASSVRSWGTDTMYITTVLAAGTAVIKIVPV